MCLQHGIHLLRQQIDHGGRSILYVVRFVMSLCWLFCRNRQSQKACDCLIATAAIIGLMSEEDLNTAWPMLSQQDSDKQTDKIPCANEYIAWTLEAGQAAQVLCSSLHCTHCNMTPQA